MGQHCTMKVRVLSQKVRGMQKVGCEGRFSRGRDAWALVAPVENERAAGAKGMSPARFGLSLSSKSPTSQARVKGEGGAEKLASVGKVKA